MSPYRFSSRVLRALGTSLLAIALVGCGIRVGPPPAPVPSPDPSEEHRQEVAIALERVINAAQAEQGADAPEGLIEAVSTYLDDVGGVWVPPPREEDPAPVSPAELGAEDDLASILEDSAGVLKVRAGAASKDSAALASMWLTLQTASQALSQGGTPPCVIPCGSSVIPPALSPASGEQDPQVAKVLQLIRTEAPALIGIYDALGYLEEIRAARSPADSRDELGEGAAELRDFASSLAGEAAGTPADTRLSAYRLDLDDLDASAHQYLESATAHWLALVPEAPPESTDLVFEALWHTYASANPDLGVEPWPGLDP